MLLSWAKNVCITVLFLANVACTFDYRWRIIYGDQIKGMSYFNALFLTNLESLKDRRNKISKSFFKKILSHDSFLHSLLPLERNTEVLSKLPNPTKYPIPHTRTKRCLFFKLCFGTLPEINWYFMLFYCFFTLYYIVSSYCILFFIWVLIILILT